MLSPHALAFVEAASRVAFPWPGMLAAIAWIAKRPGGRLHQYDPSEEIRHKVGGSAPVGANKALLRGGSIPLPQGLLIDYHALAQATGDSMNWRCLDLQPTQDEDLDPMWRAAWAAAYPDAPAGSDNALFRRRGDVPAMYFTPAAHELADAFGASECERPPPEGLHLVAGTPGAWAACFPGVPEPPGPQRRAAAASGEQGEDFQPTIPSNFDDSFRPTAPSVL